MKQVDLTIPKGAIFSEDRRFRYVLWRSWNPSRPPMLYIGLNSSTANELKEDPTVVRNMKRADQNGYGGLIHWNLYGWVSANPDVLLRDGDHVGEDNDAYFDQVIILSGGKALCGWGSFPAVEKRKHLILPRIPEPYCLGINADGNPTHPLYIPYEVPMVRYQIGGDEE